MGITSTADKHLLGLDAGEKLGWKADETPDKSDGQVDETCNLRTETEDLHADAWGYPRGKHEGGAGVFSCKRCAKTRSYGRIFSD